MTVTYGFYDSLDGDRVYNALQFSSLLDAIINDGVFVSIGSAFSVSAGTGLHVQVGLGRAWFDHTWTYNDSVLTLDISTPHAVLDRIDTVVLETNSDSGTRANSIKVIDGTPSSSPVPPTLTHTSTVNQYPLADIYVGANVTEFTASDITNRIGTSDCPFVTGILETVDIDFIFAQWQEDFETWFQYLVDQLSGEQVTMLLNLIMTHDHSDPEHTQVVTGGIEDGAVTLLKLAASLRFQKLFEFVGDGASHLDWTSIPDTFTHLLLIHSGLSTYAGAGWQTIFLRVNGDNTNTYHQYEWVRDSISEKWQFGITNPNTNGLNGGALTIMGVGGLEPGSGFTFIPHYKNTTFHKTSINLSIFNGNIPGIALLSSRWASTAAINRLTGYMLYGAYPKTGSIFTLYGIN